MVTLNQVGKLVEELQGDFFPYEEREKYLKFIYEYVEEKYSRWKNYLEDLKAQGITPSQDLIAYILKLKSLLDVILNG